MMAANNQQWVQQVETITNANQSEQAAFRAIITANQQESEALHQIIDGNIRETVSFVIDTIIHQIEK